MKIYTRGGDKGHTHVYMNKPIKVAKDDAVIEVYGVLDELNAQLGFLAAQLELKGHRIDNIQRIQRGLFESGYALSASSKLAQGDVQWLESDIDEMTSQLPAQTAFILPGGNVLASQAHICRTVCRRAERTLVALGHEQDISETVLAFVNRLSDWLFVFARWQNHSDGRADALVRE